MQIRALRACSADSLRGHERGLSTVSWLHFQRTATEHLLTPTLPRSTDRHSRCLMLSTGYQSIWQAFAGSSISPNVRVCCLACFASKRSLAREHHLSPTPTLRLMMRTGDLCAGLLNAGTVSKLFFGFSSSPIGMKQRPFCMGRNKNRLRTAMEFQPWDFHRPSRLTK